MVNGIIPPLVTPLERRDVLDVAGAARLIEHVLQGGVHGVFILGTTGEAPSLGYRLRGEMIRVTCQVVARRRPVLVGITDTSIVECLKVAEIAAQAGADAVVLSTPYYFPAGQTELMRYIRQIAEELPLPLILYNMPSLTKVWFDVETISQLADLPKIIGVKDSSGDLDYFRRLLQLKTRRPDWSIMMGPEHLLIESLRMGGDGGVNGGANVFPGLFVDCYDAWREGDLEKAEKLLAEIVAFQEIYTVGKYASRYIKATKSALSLMGVCSDQLAEPFNRFLEPQRAEVDQILRKFPDRYMKP